MQIVFTREVADMLREKYTLLELDTINAEDYGDVETFCVLEPESIVLEMSTLAEKVELHEQLIAAMKIDDTDSAKGLVLSLKGSFSGELDSFYDIIAERIDRTGTCRLTQGNPIT